MTSKSPTSLSRPRGARQRRRAFSLHAIAAPARHDARRACRADRSDDRRAARGDAGVRRRQTPRGGVGLRQLPADPRHGRAAQCHLGLVGTPLRRCRGARPRARSFAHKWLARRAFPGRAAGRRAQAGARPAGHPDVQSLLQRLHRRRAGGRRRAGLPQRHAKPPGICPISTRSPPTRRCSSARSRSTCARRRTRKAPSPAPRTSPAPCSSRATTTSCCSSTSAIRRSTPPSRRPARCRSPPRRPERFANLVVFNSLSKRSNLPGLRSGFCAGDQRFIEHLRRDPQHGGAAGAGADAARLRRRVGGRGARRGQPRGLPAPNSTSATASSAARYGYRRPAGGFFLWLDVSKFGGAAQATVTLWQRAGVKVLPGAFLAQAGRDGTNPGANYLRLALVRDPATVGEALERLVVVLA